MIIDQFCVFFDNVAAAASANSPGINVAPYAGRGEPVNITAILSGVGTGSMDIKLQESDDNSTFTDVSSFVLTKPDAAGASRTFALPGPVKKKFVRLSYTLTGTPAGLKVFAAVTRDHFAPYDKGQYIDHGKVVA